MSFLLFRNSDAHDHLQDAPDNQTCPKDPNKDCNGSDNLSGERNRLEKKISSGLTRSIWLQFGTDIKLLESEINFIKKSISNNKLNYNNQNIRIFGSLLIPSKQFISRFKFRPWKGVYIADKYLNCLDDFYAFTKDLIEIYLDNNIFPVIETECTSKEKLDEIYTLIKT